MSLVREDHRQAIDLAERAFAARLRGDQRQAVVLFRQAFEYERQAAESIASDLAAEPTRSVLLRSAATLAMDCGEFREAERLAAVALSGNPPEEITEELRSLLEQVYFHWHLEHQRISLGPSEFHFSIAGGAVGHGIAHSSDFVERVALIEKLLYRTAERKRGQPFRDKGPAKRSLRHSFELYMSAPRAGSFVVTFKLGQAQDQLQILETLDTSDVVDETLRCLELLDKSKLDELKQRIPEEAYYRNFIGLARQIAPDGNEVKIVGFTATRDGREATVTLTRQAEEIVAAELLPSPKAESVTVTGELQFADARRAARSRIRIVEKDGTEHNVLVPEGLMDDIVRPLWGELVTVTGTRVRNSIRLADIETARGD